MVTGLPEVTGRIVVQGNGAIIQRTGAAEFRILDVGAAGDLTLDRVTIKEGDAGRQQHENAAQGALTRRVADAVLRWDRRRG